MANSRMKSYPYSLANLSMKVNIYYIQFALLSRIVLSVNNKLDLIPINTFQFLNHINSILDYT